MALVRALGIVFFARSRAGARVLFVRALGQCFLRRFVRARAGIFSLRHFSRGAGRSDACAI